MTRPRHGLARVMSKRGLCSRTEAEKLVRAGRVRVQGRVIRDPEHPTDLQHATIALDDAPAGEVFMRYLMLNKPRGLVTTTTDERGRDTVYRCLGASELGWVAPVGRLDKASEGLLLFCNDPRWAARITDPALGPDKTYHVQVDCLPDGNLMQRLQAGIDCDGEVLHAKSVGLLRAGTKNAWLEIVLDEGRNRQIRRLLAACDICVLRLVRVAIGSISLGGLAKGQWRMLTAEEVAALGGD